jgi:D-sedoheptulose 7-phosphate isomerase
MNFFNQHVQSFKESIEKTEFFLEKKKIQPEEWFQRLSEKLIQTADKSKGKVYFLGNGASAGMSSHFSSDFTKNGWIPSVTLTDPSLITCFSNDYSYHDAFSEMLKRFFNRNDVLLLISSSGKSPNIVNAGKYISEKFGDASIISFSGFSNSNNLLDFHGFNLWVPQEDYGLVESAHSYFLHILIDLICLKRK